MTNRFDQKEPLVFGKTEYIVSKETLEIKNPMTKGKRVPITRINQITAYRRINGSISSLLVRVPLFQHYTLKSFEADRLLDHLLRLNPNIEVKNKSKQFIN